MSSVGNLEGIFHLLLLSDIVLIMLEFATRQKILRHFFKSRVHIAKSRGLFESSKVKLEKVVDVGIVVRRYTR